MRKKIALAAIGIPVAIYALWILYWISIIVANRFEKTDFYPMCIAFHIMKKEGEADYVCGY